MAEIIIWDENCTRINLLHHNLSAALKNCQVKATIRINSEPPLLSRMGLTHRTPVIEINTDYWQIGKHRDEITVEEFEDLLKKVCIN